MMSPQLRLGLQRVVTAEAAARFEEVSWASRCLSCILTVNCQNGREREGGGKRKDRQRRWDNFLMSESLLLPTPDYAVSLATDTAWHMTVNR